MEWLKRLFGLRSANEGDSVGFRSARDITVNNPWSLNLHELAFLTFLGHQPNP